MKISRTAREMISKMTPELRAGQFVFVSIQDSAHRATLVPKAIAMFKEDEGMSLIISVDLAAKNDLNVDQPMRCITLNVFSALDGVGLTSAVSTTLGQHGIPCNMVAAYHHDHVFIPASMAEKALALLNDLQSEYDQPSLAKSV
jgi:hypothetical protein